MYVVMPAVNHNTETIFTELYGYIDIGTLIKALWSLHGASGELIDRNSCDEHNLIGTAELLRQTFLL